MYFKLSKTQEHELLDHPETGMGYQFIEANVKGRYRREVFLVLNSEIIIDLDSNINTNIRKILSEGTGVIKEAAPVITLNSISVWEDDHSTVNEQGSRRDKSAVDSDVEYADGYEIFVRLSAFNDDKRVDKVNKCLLSGSFTTTMEDYRKCKNGGDDPGERYALPGNDKIDFAFHIQPKDVDVMQRGIVQFANNKRGGGKEIYFMDGTSRNTILKQTAY